MNRNAVFFDFLIFKSNLGDKYVLCSNQPNSYSKENLIKKIFKNENLVLKFLNKVRFHPQNKFVFTPNLKVGYVYCVYILKLSNFEAFYGLAPSKLKKKKQLNLMVALYAYRVLHLQCSGAWG